MAFASIAVFQPWASFCSWAVSAASDAAEVRDGMLGWAGMRKKQDDLGPGTFSSG